VVPVHLFVALLLGWLERDQHAIIQYLREENRVLKAQLRTSRIRFTDHQRRRLARLGAPLGRRLLAQVATVVTPDTILRWQPAANREEVDVLETRSWTAEHSG